MQYLIRYYSSTPTSMLPSWLLTCLNRSLCETPWQPFGHSPTPLQHCQLLNLLVTMPVAYVEVLMKQRCRLPRDVTVWQAGTVFPPMRPCSQPMELHVTQTRLIVILMVKNPDRMARPGKQSWNLCSRSLSFAPLFNYRPLICVLTGNVQCHQTSADSATNNEFSPYFNIFSESWRPWHDAEPKLANPT